MGAYFDGMLRYFEFGGRSTRSQYWLFFLVHFLLMIAAVWGDLVLGGLNPNTPAPTLTLFAVFVHIVPSITVQARRLHDIGKSAAWLLLYFVPLGSLVLLFWACLASEPGDNHYDDRAPAMRKGKYMSIPEGVRMGSSRIPTPSGRRATSGADGRFI